MAEVLQESTERSARLAIVARNLRYSYPPLTADGEPIAALRGIDLEVAEGECLAIVGPLGAGKSTFCLALAGLVPHALGGLFGGELLIQGTDTRRVQPADLCRTVGLVFQDPEAQLFNATVEDEVAFGPESLALPREEIARRIEWALGAVGLEGMRGRSPRELSGGQKQRIFIARAIVGEPRLLLLDEPTTGVDARARDSFYRLLSQLRSDLGLTVILASHDLEVVPTQVDEIVCINQMVYVHAPPEKIGESDALSRAYGCELEFMAHGTYPHRVIRRHDEPAHPEVEPDA